MEETFPNFGKIYRFTEQEIVVTEKIDGTNGLIFFDEELNMRVGSRNRWITPEDDNYGFARWAYENEEELRKLGPGHHYGEWWGKGIQHGYGMDRKVFSLFNVFRWSDEEVRPSCCDVVPQLVTSTLTEDSLLLPLFFNTPIPKSIAAAKYGVECSNVEGLMLYFTKSRIYMKHPYKKGNKN